MFDDPLAVGRPEVHPREQRWHTIGMIRTVVVRIAHSWPSPETGEPSIL